MTIGRITESVWAPKKLPTLTGKSLYLVIPEGHQSPPIICMDSIGASEGDRVLIVTGSSARLACCDAPVDAAIIGILPKEP